MRCWRSGWSVGVELGWGLAPDVRTMTSLGLAAPIMVGCAARRVRRVPSLLHQSTRRYRLLQQHCASKSLVVTQRRWQEEISHSIIALYYVGTTKTIYHRFIPLPFPCPYLTLHLQPIHVEKTLDRKDPRIDIQILVHRQARGRSPLGNRNVSINLSPYTPRQSQ